MKKMLLILMVVALGVAGCGDDDGGDGDLEAFCRLSESDTEGEPTDEELDEFVDVAPPEIRDEAEILVDAVRETADADDAEALEIFSEEEVGDAIEAIEDFEAENCGGAGDDDTTEPEEDDTEDEEDDTEDGEEGATGTLCDSFPDDEVSDIVGVEVSSADTAFNGESACSYESEDGEHEVFLGNAEDLGQSPSIFIQNGENNMDDFEELDGIGEAAYFGTTSGGALAGALADGLVHTVQIDPPSDEEATDYRDATVELLEELVDE